MINLEGAQHREASKGGLLRRAGAATEVVWKCKYTM
jgi:hypothetical protein